MMKHFSSTFYVAHDLLSDAKKIISSHGDLTLAKYKLELAIDSFPNYTDAFFYLGIIEERLSNFSDAIRKYDTVIGINPFFSRALYKKAVILEEHFQDYEAARINYEKAIRIKSNYFAPCMRLANLLEKRYYDFDRAVYYYITAHKMKHTDSNITFRLGCILDEHFLDFQGAKKYYERTLINNPRHAQAHLRFALLLAKRFNDKNEGRNHYLKATQLDISLKNIEIENYFNLNNYSYKSSFSFLSQIFASLGLFLRFRSL